MGLRDPVSSGNVTSAADGTRSTHACQIDIIPIAVEWLRSHRRRVATPTGAYRQRPPAQFLECTFEASTALDMRFEEPETLVRAARDFGEEVGRVLVAGLSLIHISEPTRPY